ncbi:T-cell surface glycoprotein CD3 delta chain-like [Pungitius pungitius]|uniref:T-cell surface glycoprotein CD3 delta chain-like n=1 Tax=Pungitius pungitius TaxID=134920 RepID=UPI002E123F2E
MESALSACFLLLWTLSASDRVKAASDFEVTDNEYEIELRCSNGSTLMKLNEKGESVTYSLDSLDSLDYDDSSSGEYQCGKDGSKIFVKFHTCNNCIEADAPAIAGMIVGNVVATLVIGVAVYLVASQIPGDGIKGHGPPGPPPRRRRLFSPRRCCFKRRHEPH